MQENESNIEKAIEALCHSNDADETIKQLLNIFIEESNVSVGGCFWLLTQRFYCSSKSNEKATMWERELFRISLLAEKYFSQNRKDTITKIADLSGGKFSVCAYALRYHDTLLGIYLFVIESKESFYNQAKLSYLAMLTAQYLWQAECFILLRESRYESINGMISVIEALDPYTRDHCKNVANYALLLAEELNLPSSDIETIYYGALFHDVGKVGISPSILQKSGSLSDDEYSLIKKHPEQGAFILDNFSVFKPLIPIVRHHHEFFNGSGYPDGLSGEDIPLGARIVSVVDAYDAITTNRSYDQAKITTIALEKIKASTPHQFDPAIVEVFMRVAQEL